MKMESWNKFSELHLFQSEWNKDHSSPELEVQSPSKSTETIPATPFSGVE